MSGDARGIIGHLMWNGGVLASQLLSEVASLRETELTILRAVRIGSIQTTDHE